MFPNNWIPFEASQIAEGYSLTPGVRNSVPAQIYPYAGIAPPQMPFIFRANTPYILYEPHVTYLPENIEYTREVSNNDGSGQHHYDTGEEHQIYYEIQENTVHDTNTGTNAEKTDTVNDGSEVKNDPLDSYLKLPKELFPSAKNINIDPNDLIDEFCKLPDIENHVDWIVDLEFGMRKQRSSRVAPLYNMKHNSINCLSAPGKIHPDFEKCNEDFKRAVIFYYDYIFSTWYHGYTMLTRDTSVDNFQVWLSLPIQALGISWS